MYPYPIKNLVFSYDGTCAQFPDIQLLKAEQRAQLEDDVRSVRIVSAGIAGQDASRFLSLKELPSQEMARIIKNGGKANGSFRDFLSSDDFITSVIQEVHSLDPALYLKSQPSKRQAGIQSASATKERSRTAMLADDHSGSIEQPACKADGVKVADRKLSARERISSAFNLQFRSSKPDSRAPLNNQATVNPTGRAKAALAFQAQVNAQKISGVR